jgi:hypothetical protein
MARECIAYFPDFAQHKKDAEIHIKDVPEYLSTTMDMLCNQYPSLRR